MPDHNQPDFPARPSGQFTAGNLRAMLVEGVLKQDQHPPAWSDLEHLAKTLNRIHGVYAFAKTSANASKPQADKVRDAIETLIEFFEQRREETQRDNLPAVSLEAEKGLYNRFFDFVDAMNAHDFSLKMDAGLLMPDIHGWRDLAVLIADAFKVAMARSNGRRVIGLSNDGPAPRFVAAIIPLITGEMPSVENVGQCLKIRARAAKQGR